MKIIVLKGTTNCGKTTTLNKVYAEIITNGGKSTNKKPEGNEPNDFSDIIIYKGKKIAYLTMGDLSRRIVSGIREYDSDKCHVFICACNDGLVNPSKEFAKHDTEFIIKGKNRNNFEKHNSEYAYLIHKALLANM